MEVELAIYKTEQRPLDVGRVLHEYYCNIRKNVILMLLELLSTKLLN